MEIDELPENVERLLKKPEIKRDEMGRFEQAGTGLIKKAQKKGKVGSNLTQYQPGHDRPGPGRPKGSKNKTTLALREAILAALAEVGGHHYLAKLAIENSSAFASLLARVLPTTLQASESDGGSSTVTFTRVIVMPDGQRWVEGATPKALPAPDASHALPRPTDPTDDTNEGVV
jgi:hypothetical protein